MAKVIFSNTGIEEEHQIDFEVHAGQAITLIRDGVSKNTLSILSLGLFMKANVIPPLLESEKRKVHS